MKTTAFVLLALASLAAIGCGDEQASRDESGDIPAVQSVPTDSDESNSLALFEQRILPIFQSTRPSSCSECHLSGVDLKDYVRPTQAETFASLLAAGLIDSKTPDDSKILQFIRRSTSNSALETEAMRQQELAAFREWIFAALKDPKLIAASDSSTSIGPQLPLEVVRHARRDRVLASFIDNVWNEVGRCAACHSPDRNQTQVEEHGEQVSWITLNDPQATLDYMLENGLINTAAPLESLLLTKPCLQVEHGGGQKMVIGDRTYKQFRRFIDDYVATLNGQYASVSELPEANSEVAIVTDIWLKLEGVPAGFDKMLMQVDLYRATETGWTEYRVATSDRSVFGGGNLWQHSMSLVAPRGSEWSEELAEQKLPAGRYLAKIYVDQTDKLSRDFQAELGEEDFVGQVEFESQWVPGYGEMTIIRYPEIAN